MQRSFCFLPFCVTMKGKLTNLPFIMATDLKQLYQAECEGMVKHIHVASKAFFAFNLINLSSHVLIC